MRIDPKGTIAHHPALMVRDCLRKLKVYMAWDLRVLEKAASVEPGRGRALAKALGAEGLIKRVRRDTWTITEAGQRLSSATAAKPVSRVTAERVLCAFLERVDRVNRNAYFLGRVNRVVLFGSMLRPEVAVLSDLDLAVEIVPKNGNWDQLQQENQDRVEELLDRGRTFRNILEIYAHWHFEVFRFLKGRSRVVSLADYAAEKSLILGVPHRMLLGEDEPPPVEAAPRPEPRAKSGPRPRGCPF